MKFILIIIAIMFLYRLFRKYFSKVSWTKSKGKEQFPKKWKIILERDIQFYYDLSDEKKDLFEFKVQEFLLNVKIIGVETTIDIHDKILVASSAVIPIFAFPNWTYPNLNEVLIYPGRFNQKFETEGEGRNTLGMVGTGYMEGKMILSKKALKMGFSNETDKKNTAIHEFVHLIDKIDGAVDGVPEAIMGKQYIIPWIDLVSQKMKEIHQNRSDINPYGGTSQIEFYAVVSEYFFERPKLLKNKHPKLYGILEEVFDQDLANRSLSKRRHETGRNSPCPCGSGKKFKKCCGRA